MEAEFWPSDFPNIRKNESINRDIHGLECKSSTSMVWSCLWSLRLHLASVVTMSKVRNPWNPLLKEKYMPTDLQVEVKASQGQLETVCQT